MNAFRIAGDMCHLWAKLILIFNIISMKSCLGVSGKTQQLYLLVFLTRYMDLFFSFISWYNTSMKVFYIISTTYTVYLIYSKYKDTYEKKIDSFMYEILAIVALVLAFAINHRYDTLEVLWTYSIYIESVAIVPQLYMIYKTGELHKHMILYLVPMGLYRTFYILNWAYRYQYDYHYFDLLDTVAGVLQSAIYFVFLLMYITAFRRPVSDVESPNEKDDIMKNLIQPNNCYAENLKVSLVLNPNSLDLSGKDQPNNEKKKEVSTETPNQITESSLNYNTRLINSDIPTVHM